MTKLFWRNGSFETDPVLVDVLRGVAASLVVLAHADASYMIRIDIAMTYKSYLGQIGVYLFFLLSGYLIWLSANRTLGKDSGHLVFAVHRITRVAPLYYINIAFVLAVSPFVKWSFESDHDPMVILRHLFFLQDLSPSVARGINPVLWTLTHEALFYAIVPLMFCAKRYLLAIAILSFVVGAMAWQMAIPIFGNFLRVWPLFMIGVLLAEYRLMLTWRSFLVAVVIAITVGLLDGMHSAISALWAVAILGGGTVLSTVKTRLALALRTFGWIGTVSFSLYIWHYLLLELLGPWWVKVDWIMRSQALHSALFIGACLLISSVSYLLIEKPSMTIVRRWILASLCGTPTKAADTKVG